ncbi:MAG TPA: 16S rRNA (adenine(1518)-N(6)/adenine(1519)-N(6))-dimethyltransferase RsmA [Candidatus Acidoferrales bacterium]|nr:16S rRNA (adenine(1518)-N(6)/adenine(1519)-N(6))-dimethyltransferase RsmA [Candidatus Acidoferrales bacterium]
MIAVQKRGSSLSKPTAGNEIVNPRAKKSLGQNFLIDGNIARKIVDELSISNGDTILEVGPGKGALTRLLVNKPAHIIGIEKDTELYGRLRKELESAPDFVLMNGDFLNYNFNLLDRTIKVVGNIPYNLTSKIVSKVVDARSKVDFAVLMVQEEVADRLAAKPGTKTYGAISVRLQLTARVKKLFSVPPTCFKPKPGVGSRVVRISFYKREPIAEEDRFVAFIKRVFGMRRKMLRHFVSHYYGKSAIEKLPEDFQVRRIETFPPEDIYGIFLILEANV